MDKLLKAITGMVAVEEAAKKCPDCAIGALCPSHDARFWELWRKAKSYLTPNSADTKQVTTESVTQPKIDFCYACGTALGCTD